MWALVDEDERRGIVEARQLLASVDRALEAEREAQSLRGALRMVAKAAEVALEP